MGSPIERLSIEASEAPTLTAGGERRNAGSRPMGLDGFQILENLPVAVYATDANGRITFDNDAAASLWGRRPKLGLRLACDLWRLYWPDAPDGT